MPSTTTHTYFALDVYEKLSKKIQNEINIEDLKTFAQGPDPFFFYDIISFKQPVKNFGRYVHKNKTRDYYINLINYIKKNNLINNSQVMSYLYGYICHYILDTTIHPFVTYKTGIFNKEKKETYKYNGGHYEMEYYIDIYMIYQKEHINPSSYKVYENILNTKSFNEDMKDTINYLFKETYNKENMSHYYLRGIKNMKLFFRFFNYDNHGIKKKLYKLIDILSPSSCMRKEVLSFNVPPELKINYLNLDHKIWNHPIDKSETYNYSFIDLYNQSIDKAVELITEVNKIINKPGESTTKLKILFKDLSYSTGKPCDLLDEMKYFEF